MPCTHFPIIKSARAPSHLQGASLPATAYKTGHIIKITGKEKFWEWNFSLCARVETVSQDEKKKVFDLEELMGFWLENTIFEIKPQGFTFAIPTWILKVFLSRKKGFLLYLWSCLGRHWFLSSGHNSGGIFLVSCYSAEWWFFSGKALWSFRMVHCLWCSNYLFSAMFVPY